MKVIFNYCREGQFRIGVRRKIIVIYNWGKNKNKQLLKLFLPLHLLIDKIAPECLPTVYTRSINLLFIHLKDMYVLLPDNYKQEHEH